MCVVCGIGAEKNSVLTLSLAVCGHKYCNKCIQARLRSTHTIECVKCGRLLRYESFSERHKEDRNLLQEIEVRRRVVEIFNKRLDDFSGDLHGYNDYLEEVEEIIFNLVHGYKIEEMEALLMRVKESESDLIAKNKSIKESEEKQVEKEIRRRDMVSQKEKEALMIDDVKRVEKKAKENEEVLEALAKGKITAAEIEAYKQELKDRELDYDMDIPSLFRPVAMKKEEEVMQVIQPLTHEMQPTIQADAKKAELAGGHNETLVNNRLTFLISPLHWKFKR